MATSIFPVIPTTSAPTTLLTSILPTPAPSLSTIKSSPWITNTIDLATVNWASIYATYQPNYTPYSTSSSSQPSSSSNSKKEIIQWIILAVTLSLVAAIFASFLICRHRTISREYAKALESEPGLERWIFEERRAKEQRERELEDERLEREMNGQRHRERKRARAENKAAKSLKIMDMVEMDEPVKYDSETGREVCY